MTSKEPPSISSCNGFKEETLVKLLDVYLSEWKHRDILLWAQVYRSFYAILIIMLLPNISSFLKIDIPSINQKAFPIIGMGLIVPFFYVTYGYAIRLEAIGTTYDKIIKKLPKEYQRDKVDSINGVCFLHGKYYNVRMSKIIAAILSWALFSLGIVLFFN